MTGWRPAWAEIDLEALRHNVQLVRDLVAPASVLAVVKADGYGHGAVAAAEAALAAGAGGLAVALVEEGAALRAAGIEAPVLLLSEPPPGSEPEVAALSLEPTVASREALGRLAAAAGGGARLRVHVKVDTGMHRVGAAPDRVVPLLERLRELSPPLVAAGLWTHLAVADGGDEEDRRFTGEQLRRFEEVVAEADRRGLRPPTLHAANSAGAVTQPRSHLDLVRCGILLYGQPPSGWVAEELGRRLPERPLRPVLGLRARVSAVRRLATGDRPSYGRHRPLPTDATVATVPLGYADGVPRRLFEAGVPVLLRGRRRPLAGMVTMDQIVVDCEDEEGVAVGEEVVLLGRQGGEEITVPEWAAALGTITYEVLTGIGPRVPRVVVDGVGHGGSRDAAAPREEVRLG